MELDAIPQSELEQLDRIGGADVVLGLLDRELPQANGGEASAVTAALAGLSSEVKAVVVCSTGARGPVQPALFEKNGSGHVPMVYSCNLAPPGPTESPQRTISNAYRNVFAVAGKLGARACALIASQPSSEAPQWIYRLVQPVIDLGFDLVAPRYTRQKTEGLLNRSILAPLHRALYGEQLQNPMGPDFGLSGKLLQRILKQHAGGTRGTEAKTAAIVSIASTAACGGFQICESHLGVRTQRPTDWTNLSSLLAEILGPMFLEMERRAVYWQSVRGSRALPGFGAPAAALVDAGPVDAASMIESFQLGAQNLQDVWGLVLPPTSLMELRKLARLPADKFRLPDDLWARIVYDFALGHRLRLISRDHLLRSITPLYLGWIASYALEMESAGAAEVDARIDRVSTAYEHNKSYLVSRWRWPDRFNP